ncbi:MAG: FAD-dependent oxidoreductase [Syntrophaceae bacterium]
MKALIMGGGMSGLATAINLLDQGLEVEIIEADEIFGGRANSWLDEDGDMIDNALHVFFPYYVNLLSFFKKMGIAKNILWKSTNFYFAQDDGHLPLLHFPNLPAPLHAAVGFSQLAKNFKGIPFWKMAVAALPMAWAAGASKAELDEMDDLSFAEWSSRLGPRAAFKLIEPAMHGLTFTPKYALSAKVMANWVNKISASAETARIGFANGGLGEIWVGSCLEYIKRKGGIYATRQAVTAIDVEQGRISGVTINGKEKKNADIYVSAMSPYALRKVMPADAYKYQYFQDLTFFENAPSLSIQIWFDKKLTDIDVTFFSTGCIFNTYADLSNVLPHIFKGGSMFEMVLSPADATKHLPDEVIFDKVHADMKRLFPAAREAKVKKYKVVRERQGVYRPFPGMEKHRPYQRSPLSNFYLTGDYTKTHVSSGGMEAAIWTANHCAEVIVQDKLKKQVVLNTEFNPPRLINALIRPSMFATACLLAVSIGKILLRIFDR